MTLFLNRPLPTKTARIAAHPAAASGCRMCQQTQIAVISRPVVVAPSLRFQPGDLRPAICSSLFHLDSIS